MCLTVYAVRMSALAIGELLRQALGELGGTIECGDMAVREEARGLLLPTAIFARWSRWSRFKGGDRGWAAAERLRRR